ncbi:MAG: uroporphyrinogen decarboxylase family protein, partial [Dorea sp.]
MKNQKEEMTPGERIASYLRGEEVDVQPYGLLAPEDALAYIWGYTKGEVHRSFDLRCELLKREMQTYGFGGPAVPIGLRGIGEATGSVLCYPENAVDYVKEYGFTDYKDLEKLEDFQVEKNPFLSKRLQEAERLMERFPGMEVATDVAGPISTAVAMRPIESVLKDIRKNPEQLHRLLDYAVQCSLKWIRAFCSVTGSKSVGFADPVTTTDIMGTKYFQEFSKPYLKKLVDGIVEITGQKPSVHICGHSKGIWKDLMDVGINNFSLDNCEDLEQAKQIMGEKVFLSGNVSPVDAMRNGTIDDVIHAVKKSLEEGADSPSGYMLMTGCQVPMGTPQENIDAYIYAARKYGRGAR